MFILFRIVVRLECPMSSHFNRIFPNSIVCPVQKRFEKDLKSIWKRAGLRKAPEGWNVPKLFIKQHGKKRG